MLTFPLDYVIQRSIEAEDEQRVLRRLAGVRVKRAEARSLWPRILEHKWYLSERLGRDVGLRVAAVDYLDNVRGGPLPA